MVRSLLRLSFLPVGLVVTLALLAEGAHAKEAELPPYAGVPFLRTYGADDHGGTPVNYHVVVGPEGLIYVGNSLSVLEFDGAHWREIPESMYSHTGVLLPDSEGRVWTTVGGTLNVLVRDPTGQTHFESRGALLPSAARPLGELRGGFDSPRGLWAFTDHRVLRLGRG